MTIVGTVSRQQGAVYAAQRGIDWGRLETVEDVQQWTDSVTAQDWWAERFPNVVRIEVEGLHGNTTKVGAVGHEERGTGGGVIGVPKGGVGLRTVIHEMAHTVSNQGTGHGPEFVRNYLTIAYYTVGSVRYAQLHAAFKANGVEMG